MENPTTGDSGFRARIKDPYALVVVLLFLFCAFHFGGAVLDTLEVTDTGWYDQEGPVLALLGTAFLLQTSALLCVAHYFRTGSIRIRGVGRFISVVTVVVLGLGPLLETL